MTDLTKITTPFGLLDEETQRALKECGGPWEIFDYRGKWSSRDKPEFCKSHAYRQKPQPREYVAWVVVADDGEIESLWGQRQHQHANYHASEIGGRVIKLTGRDDDRA